jgi:hypothetical protein
MPDSDDADAAFVIAGEWNVLGHAPTIGLPAPTVKLSACEPRANPQLVVARVFPAARKSGPGGEVTESESPQSYADRCRVQNAETAWASASTKSIPAR